MKCGTSALHRLLDRHPQVAMSRPKELNFFFGPARGPADGDWTPQGNWHRGEDWYARHFPADVPVRGESSPGYTSPDHPESAGRIAMLLPDARLVYLVRDPIVRAVSQYRHHRREGGEPRPLEEALLDPASQYLARSRYAERLDPFLTRFPREQIAVVATEDLRRAPGRTLARLFAFAGVDPGFGAHAVAEPAGAPDPLDVDPRLRARLAAELRDDVARLRALVDAPFADWSL
jgi:hypothetical protein